ncbi:unnamed protein product [Prorocentrum cordatum]|uniref:Uncharacterized protein n=1 Tax=Prorocentrum cordatum TaxID=2364126 RepID=A0ABN9W965_9DINO|nr:unnamed protein product [Polarella glacialis]
MICMPARICMIPERACLSVGPVRPSSPPPGRPPPAPAGDAQRRELRASPAARGGGMRGASRRGCQSMSGVCAGREGCLDVAAGAPATLLCGSRRLPRGLRGASRRRRESMAGVCAGRDG